MGNASIITYFDKHSTYSNSGDILTMGAAKIIGIILISYLLAGFVIFYLLSTGMVIPMWDVIGEIMELVFLPVGWIFNLLAPLLGLNPVAVAIPLPF